jgi:hypothetical protein
MCQIPVVNALGEGAATFCSSRNERSVKSASAEPPNFTGDAPNHFA